MQGGCGKCPQKDKDLGDACSCYKAVEKENQLWCWKKKETMSGAWSQRKKEGFTFCIEVAVAPGAEEADSLFQRRFGKRRSPRSLRCATPFGALSRQGQKPSNCTLVPHSQQKRTPTYAHTVKKQSNSL